LGIPYGLPNQTHWLCSTELHVAVVEILVKHFPEFDGESIQVQPSRTGKYHSLTAQLRFEELEQVHQLYADLAACPLIKTAL
jgi:putative lipoic acid-binding regulatory protein